LKFDWNNISGYGVMLAFAGFIGRKLLRLDGTTLRIRDDVCEKKLAEALALFLSLSVRVARLEGAAGNLITEEAAPLQESQPNTDAHREPT
jgi:hypothetical protein